MLSHLTRTPYVLTAHLGDVPGGVPEKTGGWFRWVFPLTRLIWRDAGRIAAVSQVTRELALKYYECEIIVIPNGADMKALAPKEVQVHQPPVIVFAGRFMPQKAPLQIARALNQLKDLPWKCVMIGDGPLLADTKMEVASFGMEDRFMFPGWVTPEETMMWFDQSDILFMPSLSEGLPVVGVQAVAKGLAIVASRVGGFADLVDENKNGYLFDPNDLAGFSSALRKLCLDSTSLLSFRRKSLEKANDFEIGRIAESYEEIFHSISGRSNL